mmetsp:Transcript_34610/g.80832  ORF Transcript_34610/g.80832 Transcript_34610/m.80832 type:complete len:508 (+) Transcript_34610:47-1570(+)
MGCCSSKSAAKAPQPKSAAKQERVAPAADGDEGARQPMLASSGGQPPSQGKQQQQEEEELLAAVSSQVQRKIEEARAESRKDLQVLRAEVKAQFTAQAEQLELEHARLWQELQFSSKTETTASAGEEHAEHPEVIVATPSLPALQQDEQQQLQQPQQPQQQKKLTLKDEVMYMRLAIASLQQGVAHTAAQEFRTQLGSLRGEMERMRADRATEADTLQSHLSEQAAHIEEVRRSLEEVAQESRRRCSDFEATVSRAMQRIEDFPSEVAAMQRELQALQQELTFSEPGDATSAEALEARPANASGNNSSTGEVLEQSLLVPAGVDAQAQPTAAPRAETWCEKKLSSSNGPSLRDALRRQIQQSASQEVRVQALQRDVDQAGTSLAAMERRLDLARVAHAADIREAKDKAELLSSTWEQGRCDLLADTATWRRDVSDRMSLLESELRRLQGQMEDALVRESALSDSIAKVSKHRDMLTQWSSEHYRGERSKKHRREERSGDNTAEPSLS